MKALILAGGFGKRLRPYTEKIPKPLVEVYNGKSILEYQIEYLKEFGINEIVLAVGYLKERIIERIGSGNRYGINVIYVIEENPLGTGGAIKNAYPVLKKEDYFIVMNGDIITNLDLSKLINSLKEKPNAIGAMALVRMRSPYGIVETDGNGFISMFKEKPLLDLWMNAGIYVFKPEIFNYLPNKGDIEKETFPKLVSEKKLIGVKFDDVFWKSIDNAKDLEEVRKLIEKGEIKF